MWSRLKNIAVGSWTAVEHWNDRQNESADEYYVELINRSDNAIVQLYHHSFKLSSKARALHRIMEERGLLAEYIENQNLMLKKQQAKDR